MIPANEERQRLYRIAGQINNALRAPIDIVTFCGFLSVDEIKVHLKRYFAQIDADSQRAIIASMKGGRMMTSLPSSYDAWRTREPNWGTEDDDLPETVRVTLDEIEFDGMLIRFWDTPVAVVNTSTGKVEEFRTAAGKPLKMAVQTADLVNAWLETPTGLEAVQTAISDAIDEAGAW